MKFCLYLLLFLIFLIIIFILVTIISNNFISDPIPSPSPSLSATQTPRPMASPKATKSSILPEFPWPPPKWSTKTLIPFELLTKNMDKTKNEIIDIFINAFQDYKYDYCFYSIPDGFAIVTQIEQINKDGTTKSEPDRWIIDILPLNKFSIFEYFKALIGAPTGLYRLSVFIFSPHPFYRENVEISSEQATIWLINGLSSFPQSIGQEQYTIDYNCTALIYEFKQNNPEELPKLQIPSSLSAITHLKKSGLYERIIK